MKEGKRISVTSFTLFLTGRPGGLFPQGRVSRKSEKISPLTPGVAKAYSQVSSPSGYRKNLFAGILSLRMSQKPICRRPLPPGVAKAYLQASSPSGCHKSLFAGALSLRETTPGMGEVERITTARMQGSATHDHREVGVRLTPGAVTGGAEPGIEVRGYQPRRPFRLSASCRSRSRSLLTYLIQDSAVFWLRRSLAASWKASIEALYFLVSNSAIPSMI